MRKTFVKEMIWTQGLEVWQGEWRDRGWRWECMVRVLETTRGWDGAQDVLVCVMSSVLIQQVCFTYLVPAIERGYQGRHYQLLHGQSWRDLSNCPCPRERERDAPYLVPWTYYSLAELEFGSNVHLNIHMPLTTVGNFWMYTKLAKTIVLLFPFLHLQPDSAFPSRVIWGGSAISSGFFSWLKEPLFSSLRDFESDADFFSF